MPEISRFYGIIVKIYFDEHNPPHLHAFYAGDVVAISIKEREVIAGSLPVRALKLLSEWITKNENALLENWELAKAHQKLKAIEPLE